MKVNVGTLVNIAEEAFRVREVEEEGRLQNKLCEEELEREVVEMSVDEIIGSIPSELEKAAKNPVEIDGKSWVVAQIPIVEEKLRSIMDIRGSLELRDEKILNELRERLRIEEFDGADVHIVELEVEHSYVSADGLDTGYGPCKHYVLEVRVCLG